MSVEIGTAIGQEVGFNVNLVSIGGSEAHKAQLSAGLAAAGVTVDNAPKGNVADFAMANARGYANPPVRTATPAMSLTLSNQI